MIRLARSAIGQQEVASVARVMLEDGYLGMGREVDQFESELAEYLGTNREAVICVNSGTAALHLALEAAINPGDEVLVPSLTFVATFQAIRAAGGVAVPCDIDLDTCLIDLEHAKSRLSPKTKAILPVHYASHCQNKENIDRFAKDAGLRVVEDAAHSFGCSFQGQKIGASGDLICFSFDGIKNITSGEGGAVIAHRLEDQARIRDARLLGIEKDTEKRFSGQRSWDFDVKIPGYRYHMSNVLAAIGRTQLKRFELELKPKRVSLASIYRGRLQNHPQISFFRADPVSEVPHILPIRVLNGQRDVLRQVLIQNGIECGIHYKPNHLLSIFADPDLKLPNTDKIYQEILTLPLHPLLAESDVHLACDIIEANL